MLSAKSYTRVTLALDIIRRLETGRFAGYHELHIVKHQIDLGDDISVESAPAISISCNNPIVPLDNRNLCWKCAEILMDKFAITEGVHISINKKIPVQGGLAGGSANAATTLMLLNDLWNLNLSNKELAQIGQDVGMDVPFYFTGGTAFDTESTGELYPIPTKFELSLVLLLPSFGVSTPIAYKGIDYTRIGHDCQKTNLLMHALKSDDVQSVAENMHNDFELSVFKSHPDLAGLKQEMLDAGCSGVIMSGSGSTLLGIAESNHHAQKVCSKLHYNTLITKTLVQ
jgi:4-diphosphocytidyl-2-C-methyl-D-erythritol kinase